MQGSSLERGAVLHGDGKRNDRPALRLLFLGYPVYCARAQQMIVAHDLQSLPPGLYHLIDPIE